MYCMHVVSEALETMRCHLVCRDAPDRLCPPELLPLPIVPITLSVFLARVLACFRVAVASLS